MDCRSKNESLQGAMKNKEWGSELTKGLQEVFLCEVKCQGLKMSYPRKEEQERGLLPGRTTAKALRHKMGGIRGELQIVVFNWRTCEVSASEF